ncbi:ATP-dependent RNA helicase ddx25 [Clonorchis sinensis]|uniref:RNA helicase n=1 Tax=Clonorchis sinensis TaxID=79923 RepID=A0A8T1MTY9_CLOSI|nr:ATP-dependent RNA helicase ddx25 [Clonorchis sinensis]
MENTTDWLDTEPEGEPEKPMSRAMVSCINKLLNPYLVDTFDVDLEVRRMDPDHPLHSVKSFQEMNLPLPLLKGIYSMGFYKPSMIQERALPCLISSEYPNMIAQSQSGTGKTATLLMAMLARVDATHNFCQCLCLVPTRELAVQLVEVGRQMAVHMEGVKFCVATREPQASTDDDGYVTDQVVIGTPGTIAGWLRQMGPVRLDASCLKMFVLDEADVLLEVEGFCNIAMRAKQRLPRSCQILLFSATFEDDVIEFAHEFVPNPIEFRMKRNQLPLRNIRQYHLEFQDWVDKYNALTEIYGGFDVGQAIIFCATRKEAAWLEGRMTMDGHRVGMMSGDLDVSRREATIHEFRQGNCRVLITTNLCARGLDIPQVNLIINWNMPTDASGGADCETYLHRIGRSGRFGKGGVAVNFITSEEKYLLQELESHFDITIPLLTNEDLFEL